MAAKSIKKEMLDALRKYGAVTKSDVQDVVRTEVRQIVHEEISEYHHNMVAPEFKKLNKTTTITQREVYNLDKKIGELQYDTPSQNHHPIN